MEGAKHALRHGAADTPFLEVRRVACQDAVLRGCRRVVVAEWQHAVPWRWAWLWTWELSAETHV